jgi:hypothetical protein
MEKLVWQVGGQGFFRLDNMGILLTPLSFRRSLMRGGIGFRSALPAAT